MGISLFRPSKGVITSGYGKRSGGVGSTFHRGLDFGWGNGWDIYAAANGTVSFVGWVTGYGNLTKIRHPLGYETRYAHQANGSITVREKQKVTAGQKIGVKGNTGTSSGPHLHFELRLFGVAIDPTNKFGTTAGNTITPIIEHEEEEDDMLKPEVIERTEGSAEYSLVAPWLSKAGDPLQQGYILLPSEAEAKAAGRLYGRGWGNHTKVNRADYMAIQALARTARKQWLAAQPAPATVTNTGGLTTADVKAIAKGVNDDAAARLAK